MITLRFSSDRGSREAEDDRVLSGRKGVMKLTEGLTVCVRERRRQPMLFHSTTYICDLCSHSAMCNVHQTWVCL